MFKHTKQNKWYNISLKKWNKWKNSCRYKKKTVTLQTKLIGV